jgi:protein arginine N-methyltransferase 1
LLRLKTKVLAHPRLAALYRQMANQEHFSGLSIHETMLADTVRLDAYAQALARYVTEDDVVLDLGTGTGILSFLAARQQPKQVYAVDHGEMIETAKLVAAHNDLANITFIKSPSQTVALPEKANILVQEQMGSWLFNENMIESVLDARDRLLQVGGKILPARFELFVEPVQLNDEDRVPFIWEQTIATIQFAHLQSLKTQIGADHFQTTIKPHQVRQLLCQPKAVLTFDLMTLRKEDIPATLHYRRVVTTPGRLDGFCLYFKAIFDDEISFTTAPVRAGQSHTHWSLPLYRVEATQHRPGDVLEFTLRMAELRNQKTWQWSYESFPATAETLQEARAAGVAR